MKKFIVLLLAALMIVGLCISCKEPDPKDELYGKWVYKDEIATVILDADGKGAFTLSLDEAFELKGTYKINEGKVTMEIDPSSVPAGEVDKYYVFFGKYGDPAQPYDDGEKIAIYFNAETTERPTSASGFVDFDVIANKIYSNPSMRITLETDKIIFEMDLSKEVEAKTVCEVALDFEADKTENPGYATDKLAWYCSYKNTKATRMSVDSDYSIKDNKLSIWFFDFDDGITQFTFTKE